MIRIILALFALGLLGYPVACLLDLDSYRTDLEDLFGSAGATAAQLQTVAAIHWLRNAYLAFAFLLLARYVGAPTKPGDISRAGVLIMAYPVVHILWQVLAQVALALDPEELDLNIQLTSHYLLYGMLGLSLVGIARTLKGSAAPETASTDETGAQA